MYVTIKELTPNLKNSYAFTIMVNRKKALTLEKGKKRTIILTKSAKIKVKKFFLESNEVDVTKSGVLEISLNKIQLRLKFFLLFLSMYLFYFCSNAVIKLTFFFCAWYICFKLKTNWYRLVEVEQVRE